MMKLALFLGVILFAFVAYTGIDITKEFEAISDIRNNVLTDVIDPLSKKVLAEAANSNLDDYINNAVNTIQTKENDLSR